MRQWRLNHLSIKILLSLQQLVYHVTYTPSVKVCTILFQGYECIQYQLKDTNHKRLVEILTLSNDLIMHGTIKQLRNTGQDNHNFDWMKVIWKEDNILYAHLNLYSDCRDTVYSQFKKHCITKTYHIYNRGNKGGTRRSTNIVFSDQVAE